MTAPRERTDNDLLFLNSLPGCRAQKMIGSAYGTSGLDIFGCIEGCMFFIEKKRPGQKPTPRQFARLRQWERAGAITGWYVDRPGLRAIFVPYGFTLGETG